MSDFGPARPSGKSGAGKPDTDSELGQTARRSVSAERQAAAAQIHRSLKAWRTEGVAQASDEKQVEGEESKDEAESAPKKGETINAKLLRLVHRSEKDKSAGPAHPNKPPIPDQEPNTLREQMALAAARSGQGAQVMGDMNDEPRLIAHYGAGKWVKFEYVHEAPADRPGVKNEKPKKIVLHWFRSLSSGKNVEFKFKVREK